MFACAVSITESVLRVGQREAKTRAVKKGGEGRGKNTIDYMKTSRYGIHSRLYVMGSSVATCIPFVSTH